MKLKISISLIEKVSNKYTKIYVRMFIAPLIIVVKRKMDKLWHGHRTECYVSVKIDEPELLLLTISIKGTKQLQMLKI